jgi:hypothetical protein
MVDTDAIYTIIAIVLPLVELLGMAARPAGLLAPIL